MGLLDILFKKETKNGNVGTVNSGTVRRHVVNDEDDCCLDEKIIQARIESVAAEDWPGYELRRHIPATEVGGSASDRGFDYGLYQEGQPKVMIMILEHYQYRNRSVQRAHAACSRKGIGSFNLLSHLPNRKSYIADRIKSIMP